MNHDSYDPAYIHEILQSVKVIALVGASDKTTRASHGVMKFLPGKGYSQAAGFKAAMNCCPAIELGRVTA